MNRSINIVVVTLPLVITTILLKTTLLSSWANQFSSWVEHHEWSLHINWYNASASFREEITLIYYLVIVFSLLAYITAVFDKKHKIYEQLNEMTISKIILGMVILLACLGFFFLGAGSNYLLTSVNDFTESKYLKFMFNNLFGMLLIEFLMLKLSVFIGFYTRFFIERYKIN